MARNSNGIKYPNSWPKPSVGIYPNGAPDNLRAVLVINDYDDDSQWDKHPPNHSAMRAPKVITA